MEEFYEHPLFGRGIRPVEIGRADHDAEFVQHQLADGGHGTYHSLLGLFGLGGIFFISIFLFLPLISTHFILNNKLIAYKEFYIFFMLNLLYRVLNYYVSGKGYNDYALYMLIGVFVGLNAKNYVVAKIKFKTDKKLLL
jgi:hypothetical protein